MSKAGRNLIKPNQGISKQDNTSTSTAADTNALPAEPEGCHKYQQIDTTESSYTGAVKTASTNNNTI
jgi:hypothetical protein